MSKPWKPMLAANANLEKMQFPIYSSKKLEGVRGEFQPTCLTTRPMKPFNNKFLAIHFKEVLEYCKEYGVTLEGEFYKHGLDFSTISSICRRANHPDTADLEFHVFDIYIDDFPNMTFKERTHQMEIAIAGIGMDFVKLCPQEIHNNQAEVVKYYEDALEQGYEGWVGKHPDSAYKKGRSTVNEGHFIRLKPEDTFDGSVLDIIEMQENLCESEVNELGYLSKKQDKDMKAGRGLAAVALVQCKEFTKPVRVSLSRGIKDYEDTKKSPSRESIFNNKDQYIGKHIRFVGFTISGMELPRSPRFDDWRTDLD